MHRPSTVQAYALGLVACIIAFWPSLKLDAPSSCFLLVIMGSSLFGGRGPGLLTAGLSAIAFDFFFLPSPLSLSSPPSSYLRFAVFVAAALVTVEMIEARRRMEESRRRSDYRYQLVAETATDAIISVDENSRILMANPATGKMFGWSPSEMIGKPIKLLLPELEEVCSQTAIELAGTRKDGTLFVAEISIGKGNNGESSVCAIFVRDITARKQIEMELRRSESYLAEARARLSRATQIATVAELAASVAHEISQPLSAVVANGQACLQWLSVEPPSLTNARVAAERILRDGKDAGEVVRRIRALFKKTALEKSDLNVNEVIDEVAGLIRNEAARKRMSVETDLNRELPETLGDRVQLQQVLFNLLLNGLEAMDTVVDRPRRLLIRSRLENPNSILIEVQDHGIGLTDSDKVFESFYTTKEKGMGMGLSICRSVVEAHGGRLGIKPSHEPGTTFFFTLPIAASVAI
jgi:PAS domain S-box-containing protein